MMMMMMMICASQCRKGLHASCFRQEGQFPLPSVLLGFKKLASFPHNGQPVNDFWETTQRKEVTRQKVNTFLFPPLVVDQLGNVSRCYETWADITMDSFVLDIVKHGITLDFCSQAFCSNYTPQCSLTAEGAKAVDAKIKLLLLKHVISPAELKADSFVSSIFTTMKPDGSHRTILNLKNLNESITYVHFKMESLKHVRQLIKSGVWMGSIDLRDAYYSVCVNPPFQRYFTCYRKGCYYEFLHMPNEYAQAPLLFTKLLKQPFGFLRKHGYASVINIDDSYLQGDTYAHGLENMQATRNLLVSLGFSINQDKSCASTCSPYCLSRFCSGFPTYVHLSKHPGKSLGEGSTGWCHRDVGDTVLVQPNRGSHSFPQLLDHPRLLQPKKDLLQLNRRLDMVHPLHSKLALLVTIISGQPSKVQAYQQWLQPLFVMPGEREPNSNTTAHCVDGESFVVHRKSICYSSCKCG